jgi:hypothetical protein
MDDYFYVNMDMRNLGFQLLSVPVTIFVGGGGGGVVVFGKVYRICG